jgi:hypothetical protein
MKDGEKYTIRRKNKGLTSFKERKGTEGMDR